MRYFSYSWRDLSSTPAPAVIFLFHLVLPCHPILSLGPQQLFPGLHSPGHSPAWLWESCGTHRRNIFWPCSLVLLHLTAPAFCFHYTGPAWSYTRCRCFFKPLNACSERNLYFQESLLSTDFHRLWVKERICRKFLCSSCTVITLTAPQSSLKVTLNTPKFKTCYKTMK